MNNPDHIINWWGLGQNYSNSPALGWLIITFILFLMILIYYGKTPIKALLKSRSDNIKNKIKEAHDAKISAQNRLNKYQKRLDSLEKEISNMQESFSKQAELEKKAIEKEANILAQRIAKDTQSTINAYVKRIKEKLHNEIIILSINKSRESLKTNRTSQVNSGVENFVRDIKEL